MPNWRSPTDYEFIINAHPELIAWQFLRRNSDYQNDYYWFISIWDELEATYGTPPQRDFNSWKKDPRAYRSEREIYDEKQDATTDDNLLIECWMGTKWGFYKFPVNPDNENPILGKDLTWRTNPTTVELITESSIIDLATSDLENKAAIIFDLQKNLKEQIQSAKQQLIITQKNHLISSSTRQQWILFLRLLDAMKENVTEIEVQNILDLSEEEYSNNKSQAETLKYDRYLEIIDTL